VTIDVGTGDGRAVLGTAAAQPATLVLGLDANASAMAEASRRAAGPARRGGVPNALFLLAAAEAPPRELHSVANRVTVQFPWGSLLRGCLGRDPAVAAGLASLLAPAGTLELLLAPTDRDNLDDLPTMSEAVIAAATAAFAPHGLAVTNARLASDEAVRASGSTWAKRLLANRSTDRCVVAMTLTARRP
jgi:16S rRNA (adenine(1408)-N(1))-methyltransferase